MLPDMAVSWKPKKKVDRKVESTMEKPDEASATRCNTDPYWDALGAVSCVGFVAASFGVNYQFAQHSFKLWAIDAGYHIGQFMLFAVVLGLWK